MASSVDPLVVGRVIGDVLDMFVPSIHMSVYYGSKHVTNGCNIKPSMAVDPPKLTISGHPDELYTLVSCFVSLTIVLACCFVLACMCFVLIYVIFFFLFFCLLVSVCNKDVAIALAVYA